VRLRVFELSDPTAVDRLIGDMIDTCYPPHYPPRAVEFFKRHHSPDAILRRADAGITLVLEREGCLVATGTLLDGEIGGVFVAPGAQGIGIGALVMDELERSARGSGLSSVELDVSLPSRGFYEHRGYRVLEGRSIDAGEGQSLDYWRAAKDLADES
jgi:putative acetyltransferase